MANHLAEPPSKRTSVMSKWKVALTVAFVAFLILSFVQPVQYSVSQPVAQPTIIMPSLPSVAETPQPVVVVPSIAPPTIEPTPIMTVVPVEVNAIPAKSAPTWIDIPDARISVDISPLPMTESQRKARYGLPPNVPNAFWADTFDQPGSGSTDLSLIMAHACDGLELCNVIDWQFSRLSDTGLVRAGTEIFVTTQTGKVCFVADSPPVTYEKDLLKDEDYPGGVWSNAPRPGKLVLVSCYTGDIEQKNVVVVASMIGCGS